MRSHTSGTMSLGKGSTYSTSMHHKINTKSSTEAELVAINDIMPLILWTHYFLEAQGYEVHENKVFQDNQSTILLKKNGKCSSSHRTHHINIRYFFVMDHIQSKEVAVEYCPTDEMLANMFTKPLQGAAFHHFHAAILNLPDPIKICPAIVPMSGHRSVLGNESAMGPATNDNGQTSKSIRSEGSHQMANGVKQMARNSVPPPSQQKVPGRLL